MERPNHLNVGDKSATSKATSIAIVAGIHVAVIFGLVAALNQGALMKQLQEIKATVDTPKEKPKAPPPPPPDLVKPPPPVAIVPEFQVATAPPPPVHTEAPKPPPPPPKAVVASSDPLKPIMRTHTIPPYPPISVRLNESGTTLMEVHITTEGNVDDCKIINSSSSERLDTAACDYVKRVWRWQPPTNQGAPVAVSTRVSVKWDLKDAK
ncbi:MAG TPA: energy transducer TonB [Rhizomicrobium sp.]|jgi:protein TonB|nr:energy transducer TonB [Rhizomicrobium sp.]